MSITPNLKLLAIAAATAAMIAACGGGSDDPATPIDPTDTATATDTGGATPDTGNTGDAGGNTDATDTGTTDTSGTGTGTDATDTGGDTPTDTGGIGGDGAPKPVAAIARDGASLKAGQASTVTIELHGEDGLPLPGERLVHVKILENPAKSLEKATFADGGKEVDVLFTDGIGAVTITPDAGETGISLELTDTTTSEILSLALTVAASSSGNDNAGVCSVFGCVGGNTGGNNATGGSGSGTGSGSGSGTGSGSASGSGSTSGTTPITCSGSIGAMDSNRIATAAEQCHILKVHNEARDAVGVTRLTWDAALARDALAYAQKLPAKQSSCDSLSLAHDRVELNRLQQGENLAATARAAWPTAAWSTKTASEAVAGWVAEKANYNYANNSCSSTNPGCGHYTQVVWKNTTKVGCAIATATCDLAHEGQIIENRKSFLVCRYSPPGNYSGQKPY